MYNSMIKHIVVKGTVQPNFLLLVKMPLKGSGSKKMKILVWINFYPPQENVKILRATGVPFPQIKNPGGLS